MAKFDIKGLFSAKTAKDIGTAVSTGVKKVVPLKQDEPETWFFKFLLIGLLGATILAGVAGIAGFMLTLEDAEEVVVPSLAGKELSEAMVELQNLTLIPFVEERFYNSPESKGRIMEQDPLPGTSLKSGRKVTIMLSKGAVMDKVGDYVGKNIEQVREDLRAAFGRDNPLIELGAITYVSNDEEPGTILSQDPAPGAELGRAIKVSVLVSKGRDSTLPKVPALVGTSFANAMETLQSVGLPFVWSIASDAGSATAGTVATQTPQAEASIRGDQTIALTMVVPNRVPEGSTFGLYRKLLPQYAVPIDMMVQIHDEQGDVRTLYRFKSLGGEVSFPYIAPAQSDLVVYALDREIDRVAVVNQ